MRFDSYGNRLKNILCNNSQNQHTTPTMPTPTKSEVLDAIAIIEKDPEQWENAARTVMAFMEGNEELRFMFGPASMPWIFEENINDGRELLVFLYAAGIIQSHLKNGKPPDSPLDGWLFVIRLRRNLAGKIKISSPSIERLDALESMGWLGECAAVVMRDFESPKNPKAGQDASSILGTSGRDVLLSAGHRRAMQGDYDEAYSAYNVLLALNPYDADANADLGQAMDRQAMELRAHGEKHEKAAAELIKKARPRILMAAMLGTNNPMLPVLLRTTAPDYDWTQDTSASFSKNKEADSLIAQAENAFVQRRYDDAVQLYKEALKHDPESYVATLHCGDAYYTAGNLPSGTEWFGKAVALNPNVEQGHRYLADALAKSGKHKEALDSYIAAFVAEPYDQLPRQALENAARNANPLFKPSPLCDVPMLDRKIDTDGNIISLNITPAQNNAMTNAYAEARINWAKSSGQNAGWRNSAGEEAAGLRAFAAKVLELHDKKDAGVAKWLAAAVTIKKLDAAGLLEAATYFERADEDIARAYPAYREKHRDLLTRYLREFWLAQTP